MFKRSRRKIVAAIMSVLVLLWIGTLCVIYTSSYIEVSNRNRNMLDEYIAIYTLEAAPMNDMINERPRPNGDPWAGN